MTTINAKIVLDSISPAGARLTTMQLRYPRWVHSELLTHRAFSRNASSSRAKPVKRQLEEIEEDPALPLHVGKAQKGMQAYEELPEENKRAVLSWWGEACDHALESARGQLHWGAAKQVVNRIVEPYAHIDVVVTATDWDNFFAQRCHPDTEPHLHALAWKMADLLYTSEPVGRRYHFPYTRDDEDWATLKRRARCSAARCARVSYSNHDGTKADIKKDLDLYRRLVVRAPGDDGPMHLSPLEHVAEATEDPEVRSGPFRGWEQLRKQMAGENAPFDYEDAITKGWRSTLLEGPWATKS